MQILSSPFYGVSGDYYSIATVSVSASSQNTLTFSSIPSTYKHLQIRITGRSTGAYTYSSVYVVANSDTGLHYTYHTLYGQGGSPSSGGRGTGSDTAFVAQNIAGNTSATSNFGGLIIDILDYANTDKYKVFRSIGGYNNNGSGSPTGTINLNSCVWFGSTGSSKEAITSLSLLTDGDFKQYSHAALYGIKG